MMELLSARSNMPGVTFIHFLTQEIYRRNDHSKFLKWIVDSELESLDEAIKTDYRQIDKDLECMSRSYQRLVTSLFEVDYELEREELEIVFEQTEVKSISAYKVQFQSMSEKLNYVSVTWGSIETWKVETWTIETFKTVDFLLIRRKSSWHSWLHL